MSLGDREGVYAIYHAAKNLVTNKKGSDYKNFFQSEISKLESLKQTLITECF